MFIQELRGARGGPFDDLKLDGYEPDVDVDVTVA